MVGDRENDVYTVMWRTLDCGCDFLIRSLHNRPVDEGGLGIREYMRGLPFSHTYELELQGHKGRKARKALMHLRFAKVTIRKAPTCADEVPDELTCYCVHAMEDASTVPEGEAFSNLIPELGCSLASSRFSNCSKSIVVFVESFITK